jgi:hypothetical protein
LARTKFHKFTLLCPPELSGPQEKDFSSS